LGVLLILELSIILNYIAAIILMKITNSCGECQKEGLTIKSNNKTKLNKFNKTSILFKYDVLFINI